MEKHFRLLCVVDVFKVSNSFSCFHLQRLLWCYFPHFCKLIKFTVLQMNLFDLLFPIQTRLISSVYLVSSLPFAIHFGQLLTARGFFCSDSAPVMLIFCLIGCYRSIFPYFANTAFCSRFSELSSTFDLQWSPFAEHHTCDNLCLTFSASLCLRLWLTFIEGLVPWKLLF